MAVIDKIRPIRKNPGTYISAYVQEKGVVVDPAVIRRIVAEFIGRGGKQLELDHGPKVWRVVEKTGAHYWTDDAGKSALGF